MGSISESVMFLFVVSRVGEQIFLTFHFRGVVGE